MWICVSADMTFNLRSNSAQIVLLKQRTLVRVRHDFNYDDWIFDILTPATSQHHSNARLVSRYCTVPTVRTTVVTSERSRASRRPILWCACTVWQFAPKTQTVRPTQYTVTVQSVQQGSWHYYDCIIPPSSAVSNRGDGDVGEKIFTMAAKLKTNKYLLSLKSTRFYKRSVLLELLYLSAQVFKEFAWRQDDIVSWRLPLHLVLHREHIAVFPSWRGILSSSSTKNSLARYRLGSSTSTWLD